MKYNGLFILVFFCSFLRSQETDSSYKEDQFYVSASYVDVKNEIPQFKQFGFSRSFQLGYLRDLSLTPSGQRALGIGLGYGLDYIISNLNVENTLDASQFILTSRSILSAKHRYSRHFISLPIELRWRTSTPEAHDFWRIYGGYKLNYHFLDRIDPFYGRPKNIKNNIDPWQHSLTLSMGYNTWNLYFEYGLNSFFTEDTMSQQGETLDLRALKIGLIFYLL